MVGRPSVANKAGLDAKLTQESDGKWRMILTDDQGTEVFHRVYSTDQIARQAVRKWVRDNYQVETGEAPKSRPSAKKPRSLGPAPTHLVSMMRDRADDNEERAVGLRAQADALEAEAKRLREAADSLEGPDGQT